MGYPRTEDDLLEEVFQLGFQRNGYGLGLNPEAALNLEPRIRRHLLKRQLEEFERIQEELDNA